MIATGMSCISWLELFRKFADSNDSKIGIDFTVAVTRLFSMCNSCLFMLNVVHGVLQLYNFTEQHDEQTVASILCFYA